MFLQSQVQPRTVLLGMETVPGGNDPKQKVVRATQQLLPGHRAGFGAKGPSCAVDQGIKAQPNSDLLLDRDLPAALFLQNVKYLFKYHGIPKGL